MISVFVQFEGDEIKLMDGYSHSVHGKMTRFEERHFYLPVFKESNVEIFLYP